MPLKDGYFFVPFFVLSLFAFTSHFTIGNKVMIKSQYQYVSYFYVIKPSFVRWAIYQKNIFIKISFFYFLAK